MSRRKILFYFQVFIICNLGLTFANRDFIFDYFRFKKIDRVNGFVCDEHDEENDVNLVRTFSNSGIFLTITKQESSVSLLQSLLHNAYQKIGIYLDVDCKNVTPATQIFSTAAEYEIYGSIHSWLVIGPNKTNTIKLLNDSTFSISTELTVAIPIGHDYVLYEAYNIAPTKGKPMTVNLYGTWETYSKQKVNETMNYVLTRGNFENLNFTMAGLVNGRIKSGIQSIPDYLTTHFVYDIDSPAKLCYDLGLALGDLYNFTLEVEECTSWNISVDPNGPVIKGLWQGYIDIGGSPLVITRDRVNYADYLYPVSPTRTFFLVLANPSSTTLKWDEFLKPLSTGVWYLVLMLSSLSFVVFSALLKHENRKGLIQRYSTALLFVIGALCQQGSDLFLHKMSARMAFFQIMIFSYLIYNYYSAMVVSIRLNRPVIKMNDSLNDLAKSGVKYAAENNLLFDFFMRTNAMEFRRRYWLKLPPEKRFLPFGDGINRVIQGRFAYHTTPEVAYPYIERFFTNQEVCRLTEIHMMPPTRTYLNTRKKSALSESLKIGLIKMAETGVLNRLVKKWTTRTPECRRDVLNVDRVNVYDISSCLIIYSCGLMLAFLIYECESLYYNMTTKPPSQKKSRWKELFKKHHSVAASLRTSASSNRQFLM